MVQLINEYKFLVVKSENKVLLGRPVRRWVGYIEVDPKEISMGWCELNSPNLWTR